MTDNATPPSVPDAFIDLADRMADAAAKAVLRHYRTRVDIVDKDDESPVTIADREAEQAMRALIKAEQPDHGIYGEEYGGENEDAEWLWVLDPIDGTRSFITGRPLFGTLIALLHNRKPVLGVIDAPVTSERWLGVAGRGTTLNGAPARSRACPTLDRAMISTTSPTLFTDEGREGFFRVSAAAKDTIFGGDCYQYATLASGLVDVVIEYGLKPYDFCALAPIVEGAGGRIVDWRGKELDFDSRGDILAVGDPALLPAVRDRLAGA